MTHTDLVNTCLLHLAPIGMAWSNPTGALKAGERFIRFGQPGSPDILACVSGRMVGVECKVGRDWQKPAQKKFQAAMERAGGIYILARTTADVDARLTAEGLL